MDPSYVLKIFIANDSLKMKYLETINNHNLQIRKEYFNSGFDLFNNNIEFINNIAKINTGVIAAMYKDGMPSGYYLYPRSSISKTNFRMANSVGIIDSGYRGNLIGMFDILNNEINIDTNAKFLQICSPTLEPFKVIMVEKIEDLGTTERGAGGFGSTG